VEHPWIPNSIDSVKKAMMEKLGIRSIDELFKDIPKEIMFKGVLKVGLGRPLTELEVYRIVEELLSKNVVFKNPPPFLGGGVWPHYVPPVVKEIVRRSEFYTSYTPYQPEITQGMLQSLFEYQSLIAELTGMDIVNASMYDWSTATAEALLMSVRVTKRARVIVPSTINPQHLSVIRTYLEPKGIVIERVKYDFETGLMDIEDLKEKLTSDVAAVYVENPSFLGFIEVNVKGIGELAHEKGALFIVGVDPLSLGVLEAPGNYGADIVVGEGQPLGLGMNYGGPLLGIFGVKGDMKLIRQMPGRLIGMTTTRDGKRIGYVMILQTREQHIRREKATSNICTNQALCALAAAVYLSLLGPKGIKEIGKVIMYKSHYAAKKLNEISGVKAPKFKAPFFKEFVVDFNDTGKSYVEIHEKLLGKGIHGGIYLKNDFPELGESALFCVTEVHTKEHIDKLISTLKEMIEHGE